MSARLEGLRRPTDFLKPYLRDTYVFGVRIAARAARTIGLLNLLEQSRNRNLLWLRTLFSIYDSKDLAQLDLPWWTFAAIEFVEGRIAQLGGQLRVFEYGSGASTVWLARRCKEVFTVEHDLDFAKTMAALFAKHVNLLMMEVPPEALSHGNTSRSLRNGYENYSFDSYVSSIDLVTGQFDIIIIDGRARVSCLAKAKGRLAAGGIIVFDNSNRQEYREAIVQSGLAENVMRGRAPALPCPSQTSILSRTGQL